MARILKISDFESGKYDISLNQYTEEDFEKYIDDYEKRYLEDLLGVDLANRLLSDIDPQTGLPVTPELLFIFEPFSYDYNHCIVRSQGIRHILSGFIWSEYVKDQNVKNTISGSVRQINEVSQGVSHWSAQYQERYNLSVRNYWNVQFYIIHNKKDYQDFNGQVKEILDFL